MRWSILLSLGLLSVAGPLAAAEPVRAIAQLDITRYAGQWYEIARLPMFSQRHCVTDVGAVYTLRDDGLIGVHTTCRTQDGSIDVFDGVARQLKPGSGELEIKFAPDFLNWMPLVWGDYWIIDLDPRYQWAVVGEPGRKYLWILARTPRMEPSLFESIKQRAAAMGYALDGLILSAAME